MTKPTCDCGQAGPLHLPTCAVIVWQNAGRCERSRGLALLESTHASDCKLCGCERDAPTARPHVCDPARVRDRALQEAEEVCDREYNACMRHAKAFREVRPKKKLPLGDAHEMAAKQSAMCGAYIRQLRAT